MEKGQQTHPVTETKAPAITAPKEIPPVNPAFTKPIIKPRRFLLVNSMIRMMDRVNTPAAPTPVMARPTRKTGKDVARDVTNAPMENMMEDTRMHDLGWNMVVMRPAKGATLDEAI